VPKKQQVVVSLSTAQHTYSKAERLLELATEQNSLRNTLSCCATVLLAFALEQAINTVLSYNAKCMSIEDDIPEDKTPYGILLKRPFRDRMQDLPALMTSGQLRMNYQSRIPNTLEKLITKRNKLVHVNETPLLLETPDNRVSVKDGRIEVTVPIPEIVWTSVTLDEAHEYLKAVKSYFNEVLFPSSDEYKSGELLVT
jgi:hypothetical protein